MTRPTGTLPARIVFRLLPCSSPYGYQAVTRGTFPIPAIHLGRKVVFARAHVRDLLAITDDELDRLLATQHSISDTTESSA